MLISFFEDEVIPPGRETCCGMGRGFGGVARPNG